MRAELKLLIVSTLLLSFSLFAVAASTLEPEKASANPQDPAYFALSVFSDSGYYSVNLDGPGETVAAPKEFSIQDGENKTVNIWFRPSRGIETGSYRLDIDLMSGGKRVEGFSPMVRVENDHRVDIETVGRPSCDDTVVEVSVRNTGLHSEDLVLASGEEIDLGNLEPGDEVSVNVTLGDGRVSVSSSTSYAFDSERVEVPNCGNERSSGAFFSNSSDLAATSVLVVSIVAAFLFIRRSDFRMDT